MKYLKLLTAAMLAAVAAMAFVGAGAASANEPIIVTADGKAAKFTGAGAAATFEVKPEGMTTRTVNCTASSSSGEFNAPSTQKVAKVIYTGCTATGPFGNKITCSSGLVGGEIFTVALRATLVYLVAGSSDVGVVLEPESGTTFATFTCGGAESLTVQGAVIGKLTPVNTLTKTYNLKFTQKAGHQEPEVYLSNASCTSTTAVLTTTGTGVEKFGPRQTGGAGEQTLTFDKDVRVESTKCV